mmetsp:Transcript_57523/g.136847  ORF Transcript_57523/g.136847 Transcript_57523/m.136847 type:complete len:290 (+) Transcript_57523:57-926(+)
MTPHLGTAVPLVLVSIFHQEVPRPFAKRFEKLCLKVHPSLRRKQLAWCLSAASVLLVVPPPHSPASLLWLLERRLRRWPLLLTDDTLDELPDWLVGRTGPYGEGCGKFAEFFGCWILLSLRDQELWPAAFGLGPLPGWKAVGAMLFLAAGVNVVLAVWSQYFTGDHNKVHDMVSDSRNRKLSVREHFGLAALAVGNAWCEEMVSRGFFRHELQSRGGLSRNAANFWQALSFGFWHYHGIPSGPTGVALTFVYGGIMGLLCDFAGGMLMPLVAHSIADYYIFAIIARQSG